MADFFLKLFYISAVLCTAIILDAPIVCFVLAMIPLVEVL